MKILSRLYFSYHGGSFALGMIAAAIYLGHVPGWWLLSAPVMLLSLASEDSAE